MIYYFTIVGCNFVCKIPLLARALGLNAKRATIGYLVYKVQLDFDLYARYLCSRARDDRVSCIQDFDLMVQSLNSL